LRSSRLLLVVATVVLGAGQQPVDDPSPVENLVDAVERRPLSLLANVIPPP